MTRNCWSALVLTAAAGLAAPALAADSKGVYRIPYVNGTDVRVSRDFKDHTPVGRIDMSGQGGGTHKIAAAAAGVVKYIEDRYDRKGRHNGQCYNNYVWIAHPNGEWTKYSHMTKNSVTGKAGLRVGDRVSAGQYLGDEGTVGCSSGDHLHFEVGVPRSFDPITTVGGFLTDNSGSKRNRDPRICGISGRKFKSGSSYTASTQQGAFRGGSAELARHGLPREKWQCVFDQAVAAGYRLDFVDYYNIGSRVYVNALFRQNDGRRWASFSGMTASRYQTRFDQFKRQGYRLVHVEETSA